MISVEEALGRLLAPLEKLPPEQVSTADGIGRVLAEDLAARRTQPPFAVSAMGGSAVRAADLGRIPVSLRILAEIPACAGFGGTPELGAAARGVDLFVTTGGVSVGEHDLVRDVLSADGLNIDFWEIAMRPGKPLMVGR